MSGVPPNLQQALTEAWNNMSTWIIDHMTASSLSNQVGSTTTITSHPTIAACYLLGAGAEGVHYDECGTGTITYSGISVSQVTSPARQAVLFPASSSGTAPWLIECPITAQQLALTGTYSYTQGCQEYDNALGKAIGAPTTAGGSGSFTQTVNVATITWTLNYDPGATPQLTLSGVTVTPAPAVTVTEDSSGIGFLEFFQNLLDTTEVSSLETGMVNVFQNSVFTQALLDEYNAALKATSAASKH